MRTTWQRIGCAVVAGSAALVLVACDSTSNPTAPAAQESAIKAAEAAAAAVPVSVTVRGSVVDSSNRQVANANIECLGDVQCTSPNTDVTAEGHEHRVLTTDANGAFELVAASRAGGSGFMMNANGQGYEVAWQHVAWPRAACSSDQAGCTITVNFSLNALQDLEQ